MALTVAKGTLTQPGSIGNATISGLTAPKVIILWGTAQAAAGSSSSTTAAEISYGVGTYRASTVSQWCIGGGGESGDQAAMHNSSIVATDALLKFHGASDRDVATPTIDCEIDLVSMDATSVTVNWAGLHTTASIIVHYLILCGDEITDALAGSSSGTGGATNFDITVVAGFGQPDLVCCASNWDVAGSLGNHAFHTSIGWGRSDSEQFVSVVEQNDAAGSADVNFGQLSGKILQTITTGGAFDYSAALAAKASWPTDGFRLTFSASTTDAILWLAVKGTFNCKVGSITSPAGTGNQDTNIGFAGSGALLWGGNMANSASIQTSGTDLVHYWVGGMDGTNEGSAGWLDDDGNTSQRGRMRMSTTKLPELFTNAAGTLSLLEDADSSFSGTNLRLNWTTADATAREFLYVALGSAAVAGATSLLWKPPPLKHLPY